MLHSKSSVALIVIAAVLTELTAARLFWFAESGIRNDVKHRAESELHIKKLEIQKVMTTVETALENSAWMIEHYLNEPDSVFAVMRRITAGNSKIVGTGTTFISGYYPQYGHWCELYVTQLDEGTFVERQLGNETHDYFQKDWYQKAMKAENGYWSEPYYDEAGAGMMLCSYFIKIHDRSGKTVALLGADLSLDWLTQLINNEHLYPSSFNVMISREGNFVACPAESLVVKHNIREFAFKTLDTTDDYINNSMLSGQSGEATIFDEKGEKRYVFFAPVEGSTGWSMAVVCSDREIFHELRQMLLRLSLLLLAGLVLMVFIIVRSIRNARAMAQAEKQKTSLESELRIASGIQMALLPKIFPPFPDRNDVEIHAVLEPAKEVGGDLYDFYIRDEKLIFCIGDVSGKGVPASLVMAITRTLFRNISAHESQPQRIITAINNTVDEDNLNNIFVTFFAGVLDLPTGHLVYCNAGHNPPLLIGDTIRELPVEPNLPIGAISDWKYTLQEIDIEPQTTIFLYTDGVNEAMDANRHQFGKKRMYATIEGTIAPKAVIDKTIAAVHGFVGDALQSDDLTMLAVCYTKQKQTVQLSRSLALTNNVEEVSDLADFVVGVCKSLKFGPKTIQRVRLAVEEAVVNVMNYAYPPGTEGAIYIEATANAERLKFTITDSGMAFDPTTHAEVDIDAPGDERPIGGLGIHLVRKMMDSINYNRINGKNILTLRKKLNNDNIQ